MSLNHVYQPTVLELARSGNLRAIGYWINSFLVPQGIHVRVGKVRARARQAPQCLHLLVEVNRPPDRARLVRFICHRLCQLRCSAFHTVRIVVQQSGRRIWSQSVRLRREGASTRRRPVQPRRALPAAAQSSSVVPYRPRHPHTQTRLQRQRAIAIGGSAAAALMFGYGFQTTAHRLLNGGTLRQTTPAEPPRPTTVMTVTEPITVSQQPVHNAKDPTVTLAFSGDAALGQTPLGQPLSWDLSRLEAYRRADVTLTSLEDPLAATTQVAQEEGTDNKALEMLQAGSIDIVNLASSRLLNEGAGELEQTLSALQNAGIHTVGAGRDQREARRPEILDVKGQRIAYLGYSDAIASAANSRRAGVNPALKEQVEADIRAIRDQVDWVIVNYHWSRDLAEYPAQRQIELARFAVDQGADLVIGHHSRVLQGAEVYKGRAIAYSLGNFVFNQETTSPAPADYDTAVLKVGLRETQGEAGAARQMRIEFLPVQVRQSKPEIVTGEKATQVLQYLQQASGVFEQPLQSPMVLDAQPIAPPAPAAPTPTAPATPFTAPADSFIAPPTQTVPSQSIPFTSTDAAPADAAEEPNPATPAPAQPPAVEEAIEQTDTSTPSLEFYPEAIAAQSTPTPDGALSGESAALQPSDALDQLTAADAAAETAPAEDPQPLATAETAPAPLPFPEPSKEIAAAAPVQDAAIAAAPGPELSPAPAAAVEAGADPAKQQKPAN